MVVNCLNTLEILKKYLIVGSFEFRCGEKLVDKCKSIPNEPGVYLIFTIRESIRELVYIGASGKINQNGTFKNQKLKKRLQNMQNSKLRRQEYFESKIIESNLDCIEVKWFITYCHKFNDLPLNVEGSLLQEYFNEFGVLPLWNKQA